MKKTYDSKFKSRVALEALRGELTIAEIASKYQIHPDQVAAMEAAPHEESLTFERMVLFFFLSKKFPGLNIPRTAVVFSVQNEGAFSNETDSALDSRGGSCRG